MTTVAEILYHDITYQARYPLAKFHTAEERRHGEEWRRKKADDLAAKIPADLEPLVCCLTGRYESERVLSDHDAKFARSLLDWAARGKALTPKQQAAATKLITKAHSKRR